MAKKDCPWCKYNAYCGMQEDCDFRSLPMRKASIIKRIESEVLWIVDARKNTLSTQRTIEEKKELVAGIMDRTKGIELMVTVLKTEYGMTDETIKPLFKSAKMGVGEQAKMMLQLAKLKRGKK